MLSGCASPVPPRAAALHTKIVATTFWIGEVFDAARADGSQVCSTYDAQWAYHYSGVDRGSIPTNATACPGAVVGGCDGVAGNGCRTEPRDALHRFFPTQLEPRENPFYLDLPFDDVNDPTAFDERCRVVPWASADAQRCADRGFSFMKNRWVAITGPNGKTCFGQIEDAGPSHDGLYHDAGYVFGSDDARPAQQEFENAGMDVSPALNGCLGFRELDGADLVDWRFVDASEVPPGPWRDRVTTSGVFE